MDAQDGRRNRAQDERGEDFESRAVAQESRSGLTAAAGVWFVIVYLGGGLCCAFMGILGGGWIDTGLVKGVVSLSGCIYIPFYFYFYFGMRLMWSFEEIHGLLYEDRMFDLGCEIEQGAIRAPCWAWFRWVDRM